MTIEASNEMEAAVKWLRDVSEYGDLGKNRLATAILAALPEEVTNPKPELPSEPGYYADSDGEVWRITNGGNWRFGPRTGSNPDNYAPFTRLVPEKPPVKPTELQNAYWAAQGTTADRFAALADYINTRA